VQAEGDVVDAEAALEGRHPQRIQKKSSIFLCLFVNGEKDL
jgi:hypothetical protein